MRARPALCLALVLLAPPALAGPYRLDPARSAITFSYSENGAGKTGRFARLEGEAEFDPADPAGSDVQVRVASDGIDLGDPLRSHFAQSIDWFDSANWPEVTFELDRLVLLAPGRFRAEGAIRIKGRRVALSPELSLVEDGTGLRARGELSLNRHDYGLGIGFSSLFATVSERVTVGFDLHGLPVP